MTRDSVTKIFDFEGSLETGGKEATKWSNKRCKGSKSSDMEINCRESYSIGLEQGMQKTRDSMAGRQKCGLRGTVDTSEGVDANIGNGANKILEAAENKNKKETHKDCADPGTNKSLDSFFGRDLDERSVAKGDTTKIGKDIISDYQSGWDKEPKDSGENVVNNEMGLDYDQKKGHMGDTELSKLESVMIFFQRGDEEDEADNVETVREEAMMSSQG